MRLYEKYLVTENVKPEYEDKTGKYPQQIYWVLNFPNDDPNSVEIYSRWGTGYTLQTDVIDKHPKFKSKDQAVEWVNKKLKMRFQKI